MRIVGENTRDYYDTAGWADQSRVFQRFRYDRQAARENHWRLPVLFPKAMTPGQADEQGVHTEISFGACCVAGEAYPWARKDTWMGNRVIGAGKVLSTVHIYDPDEVAREVRELTKRRRRGLYWLLMSEAADPDQFMRLPKDALADWCLDRRAATAILFPARPGHYKDPYDRAHGMINCDGLGDHELYKALDPATAHMRIDGYVSGVLPAGEDVVEIADAHRVSKAGFDERSFRTRPGTKKPRGAKRADE